MTKYVIINAEDFPIGFYSEDIHDVIPEEAIEITDEQWMECLENQGHRKIIDGQVVGYTPPPPEPVNMLLVPLKPYQFWGVTRAYGFEQPIKDFVDAIPDSVQRGIASAMLEFSLEFRRDHPLIEQARQAIGMTDEQLDQLWITAHQI